IAHADELTTIAGLIAMCQSQGQGPLPRQVSIGLGGLLGHHQQRQTDYQEQTDPPGQSVKCTSHHVCPSLSSLPSEPICPTRPCPSARHHTSRKSSRGCSP